MGKSILPVDSVTIGGVAITKADLVHGSAKYTVKGQDTATTTADGRIHNARTFVTKESSFEVYGDATELDSADSTDKTKLTGVPITLSYNSIELDSFTGVVSASYDDSRHTTQISLSVDAEPEA